MNKSTRYIYTTFILYQSQDTTYCEKSCEKIDLLQQISWLAVRPGGWGSFVEPLICKEILVPQRLSLEIIVFPVTISQREIQVRELHQEFHNHQKIMIIN